MAIVLRPTFPIPDRSNQSKGPGDIGWCEGVLSDGRPFRAEMWGEDGLSLLTFFFSTLGLETATQGELRQLLVGEGLVGFKDDTPHCEARTFADAAGNALWSVNVVIGDEDETFLNASPPIFPYSRTGEPNTLFNPVPIKAAIFDRDREQK